MFTTRLCVLACRCIVWLILALVCLASLAKAGTPLEEPAEDPSMKQAETKETEQGLYYLWSVQTKATATDNFGHYIADRYYVVELLLNNQFEKKVIITGVGFKTKQGNNEIAIAATDPQTIKGILLKKDLNGRNARAKNVIKAIGLLLTGASGFFKNVGAAATYNRSINLFNNPFQEGLNLISPNTIVRYLETLNQDIFKTGLVLPEGSIGYMRVFVDKNNIFPPSKLKSMSPEERKEKYDPTEPLAVQAILNEIVLQGQRIEVLKSQTFTLKAQ